MFIASAPGVVGKHEKKTFFIHSKDIDKGELLQYLMMQILKCLLKPFYDGNKSVKIFRMNQYCM